MAPERDRAERVLAELWKLMSERNVYRGRVLEPRSRHFHEDEGAADGAHAALDLARSDRAPGGRSRADRAAGYPTQTDGAGS
jgi:hypothetical protein